MKKRIIALALCGALLLSLTACSETGEENTVSENTEAEEKTFAGTDLFILFTEMAPEVGNMTYEGAIADIEEAGFQYNAYEPTADSLGEIYTDEDENGFHLYVATYPTDSGSNCVCTVSYNDSDIFEVSCSDGFHTHTGQYTSLNKYAEVPKKDVVTLDDLAEFINVDVPALKEEHPDYRELEKEDIVIDEEKADEEANHLQNLEEERSDLYADYMTLIDMLSYTGAELDDFIAAYPDGKDSYKSSGVDEYYQVLDQTFCGAPGYFEVYAERGIVGTIKFICSDDNFYVDYEYSQLVDDIDVLLGEHGKYEQDDSHDITYTWETDIHVASICLQITHPSMTYPIEFTLNPNYESINPDFVLE